MDRDDLKDLVSRIDERSKAIKDSIEYLKKELVSLEDRFVTQDQFEPVKQIVYGLVGIVLVSIATAVVALVVK